MTMKPEDTPHVQPEPTKADKAYAKERDRLMERAGRRLSKAAREAREREDYLKERRK
jgi:hypothetical protein